MKTRGYQHKLVFGFTAVGVWACQTERTAEVRPIETPVAAPVTPAPAPNVVSPPPPPPAPTVHTTAVQPIRTVGESRSYEELSDALDEGIDTPALREHVEGSLYIASVGHGRRFFVLAFSPRAPQPAGDYVVGDLWLHELRGDPEQQDQVPSPQVYQRIRGICLAENVAEGELSEIAVPERMTLSDLDRDREAEITILTRYIPMAAFGGQYGSTDERGLAAFIVGTDLNIQARFSRIYLHVEQDAGGETQYRSETTWLLRDTNSDGHADIRVRERYALSDYFMGDFVGEDENGEDVTVPGHDRRRRYDRNQVCEYDLTSDAWQCPNPPMGQILFTPPSARTSFR